MCPIIIVQFHIMGNYQWAEIVSDKLTLFLIFLFTFHNDMLQVSVTSFSSDLSNRPLGKMVYNDFLRKTHCVGGIEQQRPFYNFYISVISALCTFNAHSSYPPILHPYNTFLIGFNATHALLTLVEKIKDYPKYIKFCITVIM